MALRKTLVQRLFHITKISNQTLTNCRISSSSSSSATALMQKNRRQASIDPDPGDSGMFRRFLHKRAFFRPEIMSSAAMGGGNVSLAEKLREIDVCRDRIRLDGLVRPASEEGKEEVSSAVAAAAELTVEDARKLMRAAQMEMVKTRLGVVGESWIPYGEFVRICCEVCSDPDQGMRIAKLLDETGNVIVLGGSVCLRPEQVTRSIEDLLPKPGVKNLNDPRRKELEELEAQKVVIDGKAHALVRRELWAGLGYLIVQTLGFMRLTFWELSWDVMEPVCFYVTSTYFMAGYAFFLTTSKEPSFGGFYESRLEAKQKKLMKLHEFDFDRYNELMKMFHPKSSASASEMIGKMELGGIHN